MADFKRFSNGNTEVFNKFIAGLGSTLQILKEALSRVRSEIKVHNSECNAFVVSKINQV